MRKIFTPLLLLTGILLSACSGSEEPTEDLIAKGGKKYGGEFKFMSQEKIQSLFPTHASDLYSSRLVNQVFEPLLRIDPATLKVLPNIAESYEINKDATVYTFKIRKGVKFHEDDCFGGKTRELDANDVKFTLDLACSGHKDNHVPYLLVNKIKGAEEFQKKSKKSVSKSGVSGIKVVDKNTLQITLVKPYAGFESILTHAALGITAREAWEKYGKDCGKHPVGTGPFQLESFGDDKIVLKRNPTYWAKDEFGNQLPFLDKITLTYAKNKRSELMAFRKKEIDMVLELPVEEIENALGTLLEAQAGKNVRHKVESEQSMSMMYIAMACDSEEFKDERVRKAFNLAVNREWIVDERLEGEGWAAVNGFVPALENYPVEKVKGATFNVEKAQALLAEAGYPGGKNFPELDFYVNSVSGSATDKACRAVAEQIKTNLGITLKIKLCTMDERKDAITSGKAKIWREGWIADYPDAENFLGLFYGGNINENSESVNSFKFNSPEFNKMFEKALSETDPAKRTALLVKCDQIVVDKAACMPLLSDDHIVMLNARIKGFEANPLEMIFLRDVYIKEPKVTTPTAE